jgi:predicted AAA+ superfamily ATPase
MLLKILFALNEFWRVMVNSLRKQYRRQSSLYTQLSRLLQALSNLADNQIEFRFKSFVLKYVVRAYVQPLIYIWDLTC